MVLPARPPTRGCVLFGFRMFLRYNAPRVNPPEQVTSAVANQLANLDVWRPTTFNAEPYQRSGTAPQKGGCTGRVQQSHLRLRSHLGMSPSNIITVLSRTCAMMPPGASSVTKVLSLGFSSFWGELVPAYDLGGVCVDLRTRCRWITAFNWRAVAFSKAQSCSIFRISSMSCSSSFE